MIYKYDEIDFKDGMIELDGVASLDSTVFVSDGGVFEGRVEDHGTLIIRGGRADVVIGRYGKVLAHGGTLHAVVEKEGSLYIHEGNVIVKECGGYVQANTQSAYITFEESVITNMVFDYNTTIHENTTAIDCKVLPTGHVIIFKGGSFIGKNKFCLVRGDVICGGTAKNIYISHGGSISCVDNCELSRCFITDKSKMRVTSAKPVHNIIVHNGVLDVGCGARAYKVILERHGKIITDHNSYVTYINHGGTIERHGGGTLVLCTT